MAENYYARGKKDVNELKLWKVLKFAGQTIKS